MQPDPPLLLTAVSQAVALFLQLTSNTLVPVSEVCSTKVQCKCEVGRHRVGALQANMLLWVGEVCRAGNAAQKRFRKHGS